MKASFVALAATAVAVSAHSNETAVPWTTSTITATNVYTITSCAPTVTNCPAKMGSVTTEIWTTTTYCPVETGKPSSAVTLPPPATSAPGSTSTVYSTSVYTITSCAPSVTNCPVGQKTTQIYTSTSICPPSSVATLPPPVSTGKSSVVTLPPPVTSGPATSVPPPVSTGPAAPPASLSTLTISTCVPTYITSVITVYPSSSAPAVAPPASTPAAVCPGCPTTVAVSKPYGTAAPSSYVPSGNSNNTVPFTGAASSQKAGGLLIAVGLAAAALF